MEKVFLAPAPGMKVRDPETMALLPQDGKLLPLSSHWVRQLENGSVVRVDEKKSDAAPKPVVVREGK